MKQTDMELEYSEIYLAKFGKKYHTRINCPGLNAAEKAKIVTYEGCVHCT